MTTNPSAPQTESSAPGRERGGAGSGWGWGQGDWGWEWWKWMAVLPCGMVAHSEKSVPGVLAPVGAYCGRCATQLCEGALLKPAVQLPGLACRIGGGGGGGGGGGPVTIGRRVWVGNLSYSTTWQVGVGGGSAGASGAALPGAVVAVMGKGQRE